MKALIILALVCCLTLGFDFNIAPGVTISQDEWTFTQQLDHLHPQDPATVTATNWQQRFVTFSQYWKPQGGAIFVSIGGESQMHGISKGRGWLVQLAQQYNALVISLEHRYYGQSQPIKQTDKVNSWSTDNLKYLTHDQALADTAYFISQVKLNNFADGSFKTSSMNAIITVGGSYPGALSAWFRYKYPHLTVGALASSAVVNAFKNFWQYDNQIFLSTSKSGASCPANIQSFITNITVEINDKTKQAALLTAFGADKPALTVDEFLFYIPDQIASYVQYGRRTILCAAFTSTDYATQKAAFIQQLTVDGQLNGSAYAQSTLNNQVYSNPADNMRQWMYQYCSYFGWLQTPSQVAGQQMRGPTNSLAFFLNQCLTAFDKKSNYLPQPDVTVNPYYGGLNLQATNVIFTNGSEDPWKWASLTTSQNGNIAIVSDCNDCGHGVELGYPQDSDPQAVKDTRTKVTGYFTQWINDFNSQFNFVQSKIKKTQE